jgi:HD-GYP domain-containing protein (c-di-GMP phosphodiesterase class II)/DNA-binding CsgD family transcriptional regulator
MTGPSNRSGVRLAELVATISLGTDLGLGQPMEHVIRQTLIALRMSEMLGVEESERAIVYYSGLLAWVGCHTDAYEQAKWFGDDIAVKADGFLADEPGPAFLLSHLGAGKPLLERARLGLALPLAIRRRALVDLENHWRAADELARRLGLGAEVRQSLKESYERWDGKGAFGAKGDEIRLASRLVYLADVVAAFHQAGGQLRRLVPEEKFDYVLEAIGDFADLKSPWIIGHSRGVADLAAEAAHGYGLPERDVVTLRRAALVHDLGRLGVSNAIWDKRAELSHSEMERVRMHPYLSERMLSFSPALAPLGAIAVQHHEHLDGSGYPRGLSGDAISLSGRILAAADTYHAMTEMRPHRPALSTAEAASELRAEVAAGHLDGDAADAVLRAAGHRVKLRRPWPAGLSAREVEVLRLVARGLSNKEIAAELMISRKTAGSHVEHIYTKIGVSNRARASLFAMTHGLMTDTRPQARV